MKPNNQQKEKRNRNDRHRYAGRTPYMLSGIMFLVLASAGMVSTAFAADSPDVPAFTSADAAIALAIAAGGSASCDPAMLAAADINGDGCVTSLDALMILQAVAGLTTPAENRSAVIETSMGTITVELYGPQAPNTTANFIELAESGFYDGMVFHRVIDNFVIQGGCPNGDGTGGSGTTVELELHPDLTHVDGTIAMARSQDPSSASSQFYICDGAQHRLDGQYAVFGRVIDGIEVVREIAEVATDSRYGPIEDVIIIKIFIIDR